MKKLADVIYENVTRTNASVEEFKEKIFREYTSVANKENGKIAYLSDKQYQYIVDILNSADDGR